MALGAAVLVLIGGLSDGLNRQLTEGLVSVQTGHLQVVARPENFRPQNSPFDSYSQEYLPGAINLARRLESELAGEGVQGAVPFVYGRGSVHARARSSLASILGIDAEREQALRAAIPRESGVFLPKGDDSAVYAASPVARKLHLSPGDSVSVVVQTSQGAINSLDGVVCGVFRKGAPWNDDAFYISLAAAQSLFDMPGGATNIKIILRDGSRRGAHKAKPAISSWVLSNATSPPNARLRVETFDEAGHFLFSMMAANQSFVLSLSVFLFMAVGAGVINAMLMNVYERTREIGTLRALGLRRSAVARLFLLEGLVLGSVSACAGVLIGSPIVLYYGARGIPMKGTTLSYIAGGDTLFPFLQAWSVCLIVVAVVLMAVGASVYPALAASNLQPREALAYA